MTDEQFRTPSGDALPEEQETELEEPTLREVGEDDPSVEAEPTTEENK